jgi:hypothetical protein
VNPVVGSRRRRTQRCHFSRLKLAPRAPRQTRSRQSNSRVAIVANDYSGDTIWIGGVSSAAHCKGATSPVRSPARGAFLWSAGSAHNPELTDLGHIIACGHSLELPCVESRHPSAPVAAFCWLGRGAFHTPIKYRMIKKVAMQTNAVTANANKARQI